MNFAIPFSRKFKYLGQDVQLNIKYKPKIKQLDDFIATYGRSHRINLIFSDFNQEKDIEIVSALREKYSDLQIVMCLPRYEKKLEQKLSSNGLPHYYSELIDTWGRFQGFLSLDVTDIFISGELAFDVEFASLNAKINGKLLRCYCNVCQSDWEEDAESLKTFFIRPDDIDLYKEYIDTVEFYLEEESDTRINTLYEIYSKDKKWFGKLKEIIIGYDGEEDSRFIIPRFGQKRLNCNRRCKRGIKTGCRICDRIVELSKTLKDNDIMVAVDKNENL